MLRLANDGRENGYGVQGEVDEVSVSFEIQKIGANQSFGLKLEVVGNQAFALWIDASLKFAGNIYPLERNRLSSYSAKFCERNHFFGM